MKNINISVSICVKDIPITIHKVIDSFLNQTDKPLEIVIVGNMADVICRNYKNNRIIKSINFTGDKNDARNIGFLNCKGDFIIYSDHDMIPEKNLILEIKKTANKCDAIIIPEVGIKKRDIFNNILCLEKDIVQYNKNSLTPRVFKRNLFSEGNLPFNKKFGKSDEWGFAKNLYRLKPVITSADTKFYIDYEGYTLTDEIIKKFNMGKDFFNIRSQKKHHEPNRYNIFERFLLYFKHPQSYLRYPFEFIFLILLKLVVGGAFVLGLITILLKEKLVIEKL